MTAADERNERAQRRRARATPSSSPTRSRPGTCTTSPRSPPPATTRACSARTCSTRARSCPRPTTARSSSPRRSCARSPTVPWRVYRPGDRRRPLADRRDGQDRRPLLLLQGDPEGAPRAARVGAARRPGARLHEHRARSTSSPTRWTTSPTSPASTARRSTSPTRAVAALGRGAQRRSPGPRTRRSSRCASTSA